MKHDNQHLDFLVSQLVDDTLDATNRKAIEQQIHTDPVARTLYKDHRDMQDVLDDWGNRLPLINWDQFDQTLAFRLEAETVGVKKVSVWARFGRQVSIAAAVLICASVGVAIYEHNTTAPMTPTPTVAKNMTPVNSVNIPLGSQSTQPSTALVTYPESLTPTASSQSVAIAPPANVKSPSEGTALNTGSAAASDDNHVKDKPTSPEPH